MNGFPAIQMQLWSLQQAAVSDPPLWRQKQAAELLSGEEIIQKVWDVLE